MRDFADIPAGSNHFLVYTDDDGFVHLERRWTADGTLKGDEYVFPDYAAHDIGSALLATNTIPDDSVRGTVRAVPKKRGRMLLGSYDDVI